MPLVKKAAAITFDDNKDCNGEIFALKFRAFDDAEDGDYTVSCSISAKKKVGETEVPVEISAVVGKISITSAIPGDVNGDEQVTSDDAIHLLYYTLLPDLYPINQSGDFDGSGDVNSDDAIYLLYYTLLPDLYPLK